MIYSSILVIVDMSFFRQVLFLCRMQILKRGLQSEAKSQIQGTLGKCCSYFALHYTTLSYFALFCTQNLTRQGSLGIQSLSVCFSSLLTSFLHCSLRSSLPSYLCVKLFLCQGFSAGYFLFQECSLLPTLSLPGHCLMSLAQKNIS